MEDGVQQGLSELHLQGAKVIGSFCMAIGSLLQVSFNAVDCVVYIGDIREMDGRLVQFI